MFLCGSLGTVLPFLSLSQENSEAEQFIFNLWENYTQQTKGSAKIVLLEGRQGHFDHFCM